LGVSVLSAKNAFFFLKSFFFGATFSKEKASNKSCYLKIVPIAIATVYPCVISNKKVEASLLPLFYINKFQGLVLKSGFFSNS
jgi:hypothetical protein